ncbi:uncharacterized protein LOC121868964 [Homarus americanus]|uniref:uncharacterized protein LOC121868964 n=1 Tax=Homarus americanus TaxID=6706 RepID=UPI001C47E01B|nr:uncharacterized protein LOC121868964 [Homarus americanus]
MGLSLTEEKNYCFTYHLHLDTDTLRCPSGLRLCKLGKAGVRRLLEESKFDKNFPLEPMLRFNQKVPSVGVFLDNSTKEDTLVALENILPAGDEDIPISLIASAKNGALGMLRTEESYKKQGLGTLVTRAAARLQANQGYFPLANVELDNKASRAMFTKMPEFINTHIVSWMFQDIGDTY